MATKKIKKYERRGRPKKETQIKQETDEKCEHWFQDPLVLRLVQLIGSQGQILFKSLSGQKAFKYRKQIEAPTDLTDSKEKKDIKEINERKQQFSKLKEKRQQFLKQMNKFQTEFLNKYYEKKEAGQEWAYLLIKKNNLKPNDIFDNIIRKDLKESLAFMFPLLDNNFIRSFRDIVNEISIEDLLKYDIHQTLNLWALIKAINDGPHKLLERLQIDSVNPNEMENLIKQVDESIQNQEKIYQKTTLEQLLERYKDEREQVIEKLIGCIKEIIRETQ